MKETSHKGHTLYVSITIWNVQNREILKQKVDCSCQCWGRGSGEWLPNENRVIETCWNQYGRLHNTEPLNVYFEMVKLVNFTLYEFYLKKILKEQTCVGGIPRWCSPASGHQVLLPCCAPTSGQFLVYAACRCRRTLNCWMWSCPINRRISSSP